MEKALFHVSYTASCIKSQVLWFSKDARIRKPFHFKDFSKQNINFIIQLFTSSADVKFDVIKIEFKVSPYWCPFKNWFKHFPILYILLYVFPLICLVLPFSEKIASLPSCPRICPGAKCYRPTLGSETISNNRKTCKNDKACFLFHVKSSFHLWVIFIFVLTFWLCRKTSWLESYG